MEGALRGIALCRCVNIVRVVVGEFCCVRCALASQGLAHREREGRSPSQKKTPRQRGKFLPSRAQAHFLRTNATREVRSTLTTYELLFFGFSSLLVATLKNVFVVVKRAENTVTRP